MRIPTLSEYDASGGGLTEEEKRILDFAGGAIIFARRTYGQADDKHKPWSFLDESLHRQHLKCATHANKAEQQLLGEEPSPDQGGEHHLYLAIARAAQACAWMGIKGEAGGGHE